jgi:hypothetical protein
MPEVFPSKKVREKVDVVVSEIKKMVADGYSSNPLRTMAVLPKNSVFEAQNDDEEILLMMRSHPIVNIGWILMVLIAVPIPWIWGAFPLFENLQPSLVFFISVLWYLGILFFAVERFLVWFYSVYIVTDERVIDVDFGNLLYKNVDVTQIRNIEEANYSQVGLFGSVFNYGNVVVQTASEQRTTDAAKKGSAFTFESVPNPDRVTRVISELMQQEEVEMVEGRVR